MVKKVSALSRAALKRAILEVKQWAKGEGTEAIMKRVGATEKTKREHHSFIKLVQER